MRRFILLAFIGMLLMKNTTSSKNKKYPWLFGYNRLNENDKENKPTVCQSQECKIIAQIISDSMDKSVNPCDDFYTYACGKWAEHNPSPKGMESSWNMFESMQIKVIKRIKEIVDDGVKDDDLLAVKLAKKWYAVCIDTDTIERQGLEPLVFTLARIGGWPMIMEPDEWNEQEYSWQKVDDQYVRLTGRNAFHNVRVVEYSLNESRKIVEVDTPDLPSVSFWSTLIFSEEEEDESDEDPSDEEKQSEQRDNQESGSKDENDNNSNNGDKDNDNDEDEDEDEDDNNNDEDDDNDNNNDDNNDDENDDKDDNDDNNDDENDDKDDNDDNNDDTNEQDNDENAKKKVAVKKNSKLAKSKKLGHGRKIKNSSSKKHENHKTKKQRIKRRAISTNVREKLRTRKNEKNHMKQARKKEVKKTLEATTPRTSTKETTDEDDIIKQYADYVSKVARIIAKARGVAVSEEHMNKDIEDMIAFQIKLIDITMSGGEEEELTLNDFQEWYDKKKPKTSNSAIDWPYKIGELFDEAHVPVNGDLELRISEDYFESLVSLLDNTSSRTIVNYIHWNFLTNVIRTTTSQMRKLYDKWEKYVPETQMNDAEIVLGIPYRAVKCALEADTTYVGDILAYEYVRKQFSDDIMTTASDMMDDIQKEVEYQIKESNWMDEDTKDFILAKLVNMEKFIGYPDWYKNNTIVKRFFQGLIIGNSYYENTLSYDRYSKWKNLRQLKENKKDEVESLSISPVMVNALFSSDFNSVAFSAADFQSPLFAYDRPQAINYGIVGSIMGHEVNHGFDDSGHLYDKKGKLVKWLSAMSEAYGKRAECFVEQFNYLIDKASNYKIKNYGNQTAGENIADTMGLEAAFRAYRRRERECGKPNTILPGHENLTNDQLFFLSFANLWCELPETNKTLTLAKIDEHSTGRLRVTGSISNSQDFAKAYNCPIGSTMNPERKCNIWK